MRLLTMIAIFLLTIPNAYGSMPEPEGWRVRNTNQSYPELLDNLRTAVSAENMGLVTDVGPTRVAAQRGEYIPGNRVIGVFRNDFAVRALRASVPAMIEAPIRFYVTENDDGTATLSWKRPSYVFAPYFDEGNPELREVANELDKIFRAIGEIATETDG